MTTVLLASSPSSAQEDGEGLKIYFDLGSSSVASAEREKLDQAARLYREGNPIVMTVSGGTDTVGPATLNLALSLARANTVLQGLIDRGIPAERLQVVGRGETELETPTDDGVAEQRNRLVEINWR
ncbi:MAG: OmpA family protein [Paracoccaceae bacterium]